MNRTWLLSLLLFASAAMASDLLPPDEFTLRYIQRVNAVYPEADVAVGGALEVSVKHDGDKSFTSFLDNAYAEYRADPDAVDDIIAGYVQALGTFFAPVEHTRDRSVLVPVVKGRQYIEDTKALMARDPGDADAASAELYFERLTAELVVLYAFDSEHSLMYASRAAIAELGTTEAELRTLAIDNLMERLPEITREGDDSLSMLVAGGTFEASLLLVDELWTKENFNVKGDIVVFVPARDVVLVTGSKDKDGLKRAQQIVRGTEWSYTISPASFIRRDGVWKSHRP